MDTQIKVAIADSNCLFRLGVRSALSYQTEIAISGEVGTLEQLKNLFVQPEKPDVLIVNLSIASTTSLDFLKEIVDCYPSIPVIAMGMLSEEAYAARVLRAGAAAYLRLDCAPEELIEAVKVVKSGRMYLTSRASNAVIEHLQSRVREGNLHSALSDREYQIFTMICRGVPLVRIGEDFGISVKTVSTYRSRILKKMNMHNNAELIQYAVKNEIVESLSA